MAGENPVGWFEVYVKDMDRARRFYETVFQVTLERLPAEDIEMYAFPMKQGAPGSAGALVRQEGVEPGGNSVMIYFMCDDCAETGSRVPDAGGRIHREKMSIGQYGFIVLAYDSEGNMIGLHSMT